MQPKDSNVFRCAFTAAMIRGSKGMPPRFLNHATRTPLKDRPSAAAKREPGSVIEIGQRSSGPAMALRNSATSGTVRAMGPSTLSVDHAFPLGNSGTRPGAVRNPTTPQNAAGLRSEPPISLPLAIGVIPQASATAAPPLDPPQVLLRS